MLHSARAYDLVAWVLTLGRERRFREHLVDLARLDAGDSVLDVGCGTGALAMAAKTRVGAGAQVCGVDPSPQMIARARRKAARREVDVRFETAAVEALPFPYAAFDAVLSTLMLHHLTDDGRREGIGEIARVLAPGGTFLAVDIGGDTAGRPGRHHTLLQLVRRHADFDLDELTPALEDAGFDVAERGPVDSPGLVGIPNLRFVRATAGSRPRPSA